MRGEVMLYLIGVGHVFPLREKVRELIKVLEPEAVCVELDQLRYKMLLEKERGGSPFPFSLLSRMYDRASEVYGAEVGEEMLGAIEAAKELKIPYFFMDVPVQKELPSALRELPLGERVKLVLSAFAASLLPRSLLKKATDEVMEDPQKLSQEFEKHYPELKKILLDSREDYMARRLSWVLGRFSNVVAVVGEGHLEGLQRRLQGTELKVVHLKELINRGMEDILKMGGNGVAERVEGVKIQFVVKENPWEEIY